MFNIKLEEKSHKMSLKVLTVKIQRSKNRLGRHNGIKNKSIKDLFYATIIFINVD